MAQLFGNEFIRQGILLENEFRPSVRSLPERPMEVPDLLQNAMKLTGLKQTKFAREVGVSQSEISKWISCTHAPNKKQWDRVLAWLAKQPKAQKLLKSANNLAHSFPIGPHDDDEAERLDNSRRADMPQPIDVPEIDLHAGAAYAGGFGQEESMAENGNIVTRDAVRATWGIPLPFLRDELGVRPGNVHILPVRGDSMESALFAGDRAVIDLDDRDVSQGGIFALIDDIGSVIIKQVELVRASEPQRIRCKSRNQQYEPFELVLLEPVRIIGRVACKITRL